MFISGDGVRVCGVVCDPLAGTTSTLLPDLQRKRLRPLSGPAPGSHGSCSRPLSLSRLLRALPRLKGSPRSGPFIPSDTANYSDRVVCDPVVLCDAVCGVSW